MSISKNLKSPLAKLYKKISKKKSESSQTEEEESRTSSGGSSLNVDELRTVFDYIDTNSDGKISGEELISCISLLGGALSSREAEEIVKISDVDGDGFMDFDEFLKFMEGEECSDEERRKELKEAFGMYVTEGEEFITAASLRRTLSRLDIRRPFKVIGKERTFGPWKNTPRFVPSSEEEMKLRYAKAKANPGYSRLQRNAKVIGTWDDHDYGLNDAGKEFDRKVANQKLMLDFLDEPLDSTRRKQAGVYASYTYGPPNKKVKVILLDTRYHRDPLRSDGRILGDTQWRWLEKELRGPRCEITIIGSSVQVISNLSATTGPLFYTESWGRFPKERKRLFQLIADTKRNGVIFISGDVHFGEITRYDCSVGYPLYDVTSSGLVQSVEKVVPGPLRSIIRLLFWYTPSTMRVLNENCKYKSCTYGQQNFGAISIDWNANPATIRLEIRDVNGQTVLSTNVTLSELQPQGSNSLTEPTRKGKSQRYCTLEIELPGATRYRLAVLIYLTIAVLAIVVVGLIIGAVLTIKACVYKCKVD